MPMMKESGVEWIGSIPEDWTTKKIKYLPNNEENAFVDGDWIDSPFIIDEGIRYYTTGNIGDGFFKNQGSGYISEDTFRLLGCKYAYPGDLVFSRLNAPYGRSCILPNEEERYVLAVDNAILRTDEDKRFICYVTQCSGFQHSAEDVSNGTTMKRIGRIKLGNLFVPLPPRDLQERIANYLDKKCSEIDTLLEELEKEIHTLEEYKKSVITEAVTKGLNGDVELKDSGVDWIGQIPKHWCVKRIKYIVNKVGSGKTPKGDDSLYLVGDILFLRSQNIYNTGLKLDDVAVITEEIDLSMANSRVYQNDVLLNITGGSIGRCCIYDRNDRANVNQHVCIIRVKRDRVLPEFMRFFWNSELGQTAINLFQTGGNREGMSAVAINNTPMPYMEIPEQQEIVNYLTQKCSEIESVLDIKRNQILVLEEMKKSIIYEYVTGKKEVPSRE